MTSLSEIDALLSQHGLVCRGGFDFADDDTPPADSIAAGARAVILIGNAGSNYWANFLQWRAGQPEVVANPLDTWSRSILEATAVTVGARVVMPNDRPYAPFQRWAMQAQGLKPSPIGILMHPRYGLWHAYRGALLLDRAIGRDISGAQSHACDHCVEKPCLSACPISAFDGGGFAYQSCRDHVRGPEGEMCRAGGCIARNACPAGERWRYQREVQAFHQKAFAGI